MQQRYDEIRRLGGEVLAVAFAPSEAVAAFVKEAGLPFPVVGDPTRRGIEVFGLGRTSWWTILRPRVILRYLRLMFRGWGPRKKPPEEDLLQLGGDFVLDAQSRVVFAYRSADPTDRPPVEQLLTAVRDAAGQRATTDSQHQE